MSHSRANMTKKAKQPAETSSSLAERQCQWFPLPFSPARAAPGWSSAEHCRSGHWDPQRSAQGIPKQGRNSHCYSWRHNLLPWMLRGDPCKVYLWTCGAPQSPVHVAWHDLISPLEKEDPWEIWQVSQCPSCYFIPWSNIPPVWSVPLLHVAHHVVTLAAHFPYH